MKWVFVYFKAGGAVTFAHILSLLIVVTHICTIGIDIICHWHWHHHHNHQGKLGAHPQFV